MVHLVQLERRDMESKILSQQDLYDVLPFGKAAEYSNIGINRLAMMVSEPNCSFALFVGNKKLIKRIPFEEYINSESVHFI